MRQAQFDYASSAHIQIQATRVLPGHDTGEQVGAVNDEVYHDENSPVRLVFSVLANVVGGVLLLYGLFILPHVVAGIMN